MPHTLRRDVSDGLPERAEMAPAKMRQQIRKAERVTLTPARLRAFLAAIEKPAGPEGCWLWRGSVNSDGYPCGMFGSPVHRRAYEWMVGPIPDGLELDHLCRTPRCVNPHHLEPVTKTENQRRRCQPDRQWEPRRYCRRGHVLDARNGRAWSNGKGLREIRCYLCHDGVRTDRSA